jgi:hypothetical protein
MLLTVMQKFDDPSEPSSGTANHHGGHQVLWICYRSHGCAVKNSLGTREPRPDDRNRHAPPSGVVFIQNTVF